MPIWVACKSFTLLHRSSFAVLGCWNWGYSHVFVAGFNYIMFSILGRSSQIQGITGRGWYQCYQAIVSKTCPQCPPLSDGPRGLGLWVVSGGHCSVCVSLGRRRSFNHSIVETKKHHWTWPRQERVEKERKRLCAKCCLSPDSTFAQCLQGAVGFP